MEKPTLVVAISKLAVAGEQAGFTLEEMIELLDGGLSLEMLLELIPRRLQGRNPSALRTPYSSGLCDVGFAALSGRPRPRPLDYRWSPYARRATAV